MIDPDDACPLCPHDLPEDLVEKITSAQSVGEPMSLDDAKAWLSQIAETDSDIQSP